MMGKRTRELEELNNSLQKQVDSLQAQLEQYRSQEQAIAQALTQAQTTAAKLVADANARANSIIAGAEAERATLEQEIVLLRSKANGQAAAIVEAAQQEATRRIEQAEAVVAQCRTKVETFNAHLVQTAQQAKDTSDYYARQIDELRMPLPEITTATQTAAEFVSALPESENPIQLVDPNKEAAAAQEEIQEEAEPLFAAVEEIAEEEAAEEAEEEIPAPKAPVFNPRPAQDDDEDRVWTVEEILAAQKQKEDEPAAEEANQQEEPQAEPELKEPAPAAPQQFRSGPSLDDLLDEITREL